MTADLAIPVQSAAREFQTELEVLRLCEEILKDRETTDSDNAWLWAGRRRVAQFCLRQVEHALARMERAGPRLVPSGRFPAGDFSEAGSRVEEFPADEPPDAAELEFLLRSHHLLQYDATFHPPRDARDQAEWMEQIRRKARAFADCLARRAKRDGRAHR